MQNIWNISWNQFKYLLLNIETGVKLHFDVCEDGTEKGTPPSPVHESNLMSVIKHIPRKIWDHEKWSNLHDFQMI